MMYSRWIMVLMINLLPGCAFIDGLHNQQDQTSAVPAVQGKAVALPGAAAPSAVNSQNDPKTNAAKTITPLTQ